MKAFSRGREMFARDDAPTAAPRWVEDGIEATDDSVWVWLHVPNGNTHLLEDDDLNRATLGTAHALRRLLPPEAEYHIKVMWAAHSAEDYRDSWEQFDSVRAPGAPGYIELGAHRVTRNTEDGIYRRRVVLFGLRWPMPTEASLTSKTRKAARTLRSGAITEAQARDRIDSVRSAVDRWIRRMADSPLRAERAPASMIAWSFAREMRRGVPLEVPEASAFGTAGLASLFHGKVDPSKDPNYLTVTDLRTGYRRYVALLTPAVNGFPVDELEIPGGEWLEMLTELPGVEASVRGVQHGQVGSIKLLDDARKVARSQDREGSEHGAEVDDEVSTARSVLNERRTEVQRRLDVETTNHCRWIVDGESVDELDERIAQVKQLYTGTVQLEVVPNLQKLLWKEILPGDRVRVPDYGQDQPMRTLAGSWFHGGSTVGDATGPYLGANLGSTPGPIQLHLVSRSAEHRGQPTTVTFTGRSGEGKSTGLMLSSLSVLAEGAWECLVDPKGDLGGICEVAREILGVPVQVVDILDESCSGMMDPLRFAATADEARGLTLDALLGALSSDDRRRAERVLETAVDRVLSRPRDQWSCPAVIGELVSAADEIAQDIGTTLAMRAKLAQLRAVLGPLPEAAQPLLRGRGLVYLGLAGLDLPRHTPDPDRWSITERASMTTYRLSMAYALAQSRDRQLKKVVALTELHLITRYPEGRAFIEWIGRTGRAMQVWQFLDTQSATELAEIPALVEQVVMSFAFAADGQAEQDAQAVLLRREPGPRLREAQASLRPGECIVRDRAGQVAPMQFDRLTRWIAETLATDATEDHGTYETASANGTGPAEHVPAAATTTGSEQ